MPTEERVSKSGVPLSLRILIVTQVGHVCWKRPSLSIDTVFTDVA